jgi:hypothetical protein
MYWTARGWVIGGSRATRATAFNVDINRDRLFLAFAVLLMMMMMMMMMFIVGIRFWARVGLVISPCTPHLPENPF